MRRVYLDHNATSPLRPEARDAMLEVWDAPTNASSVHGEGRAARKILDTARETIAGLTGAQPSQIYFTCGATEANNWILNAFPDRRVLVSAIEHPSVLNAAPQAERLPVTQDGIVDLNALETMLAEAAHPALIATMLVNNETGAIQPLKEIVALARNHGALVQCDAVQAAGRLPLSMRDLGVDYLTLSAHKLGGPQGVGALVTGPCAELPAWLKGGAQESRRRAGTENIAGIAGFAASFAAAAAQAEHYRNLSAWRDRLEAELRGIAPDLIIFAERAPRVGNTSLIALPGLAAETQLIALDLAGIAVSSGSACSSGKVEASPGLLAMGYGDDIARCALRISLGWTTVAEDIARFVEIWQTHYERHARRRRVV